MNKYKEICGVDISNDVFDVYGQQSGHHQFKNDARGFISFLKSLSKGYGSYRLYHYRLAQKSVRIRCKSAISKAFYSDKTC